MAHRRRASEERRRSNPTGFRALDLFCGGGGAALGLQSAGFEVVGVDIADHSAHYPGTFVLGDALDMVDYFGDYHLIWASPPCQRWSSQTNGHRPQDHLDLVAPIRDLMSGHPWTVIENVPRAPVRADVQLTGPMVGLQYIERHRIFEVSWDPGPQPKIERVPRWRFTSGQAITVTTSMSSTSHYWPRVAAGISGRVSNREAREKMGIPIDMTNREIGEAIPPRYAEYVARSALRAMHRS